MWPQCDGQTGAAKCEREKREHHHPALLPERVLADHAPRGIELWFDEVQRGKQQYEQRRCRE
jgi:hypothetical protein